jgi:hypothetical protein
MASLFKLPKWKIKQATFEKFQEVIFEMLCSFRTTMPAVILAHAQHAKLHEESANGMQL